MRSVAAVAAFFAAGALAGPVQHHKHQHAKKDLVIVTDYDIVVETVWVTDTETPATTSAVAVAAAPTSTAAAAPVINIASIPQQKPAAAPAPSVAAPAPSAAAPAYSAPAAPAPAPVSVPAAAPVKSAAPAYSAPAAPAAAPINLADYQAAVVLHHNIHRANHSAPDLAWDAGLAAIAQSEAAVCIYAHNVTGGGYGQNIAAGVHADNVSTILTDMFYNAEMPWYTGMYGETNPDFTHFDNWGHFSQMVWKDTTKVGCATVDCTGVTNAQGGIGLGNVESNVPPYFTVCNYSPPGNMGGEYGTNIGAPSGSRSVDWAYAG